jgi:hypothetical protein
MRYLELILEKHIYFMIMFCILSLMSVCLDQRKTALFQNLFAGIPPNISRAFRYRNLYFFKDNMFYEFDDISNTLVKSDKFDLTVFGFKCGLNRSNNKTN